MQIHPRHSLQRLSEYPHPTIAIGNAKLGGLLGRLGGSSGDYTVVLVRFCKCRYYCHSTELISIYTSTRIMLVIAYTSTRCGRSCITTHFSPRSRTSCIFEPPSNLILRMFRRLHVAIVFSHAQSFNSVAAIHRAFVGYSDDPVRPHQDVSSTC